MVVLPSERRYEGLTLCAGIAGVAGGKVSRTRTKAQSLFSCECIRKSAFLKDRDPRVIELLIDEAKVKVFQPGELIMKQGDPGDEMFFVDTGRVEVIVENGGNTACVAVLGGGSVVGEFSMLGLS